MTRKLYKAALIALCATVGACDIGDPLEDVNLKLRLTDAPVELTGLTPVQVKANTVTTVDATVSPGDAVASVDAISSIKLQPSFFTYTPAAGSAMAGDLSAANSAASGTVFIIVMSGSNILLGASLTIVNNTVTAVNPSVANLETMAASIRQFAAANPTLAAQAQGAANMTGPQLLASINAVLTANSSPIRVYAIATGDLNGSMLIREFRLDGEVTVED